MNELNVFIKEISIITIPFLSGVLIYGKDEILSKIIGIFLFFFGGIIISVLVADYTKTREARRSHVGHGDLK